MREVFMALLAGGRSHGYELKQSMEQEFGPVLPALNTGQIYSTLARLERDGLVEAESVADDNRGKKLYRLTDAGRRAVEAWVGRPVPGARLKEEFFLKLIVATATGLAEPDVLIEAQRAEYFQSLRDLDARLAATGNTVAADLLIEGAVLHLKADLDWLDLIEDRLRERTVPA
jgi:DNA-binding PadR family transcriptional regulator